MCTEPFDVLLRLEGPATREALDALRHERRRAERAREGLVAALHDLVPAQPDRELRRFLLALKRDVHNGRSVSAERAARLAGIADATARRDLTEHRSAQAALAALDARGARVSAAEARELRRRLAVLAEGESLRRGLVLSSRAVHRALERYPKDGEPPRTKRVRDLERTLLKYLTRVCAKTSPFSTFTQVGRGRIVSCLEGGAWRLAGAHEVRGLARVDPFLHAALREGLARLAPVRRRLSVAPNPTLVRDGDRWTWLLEHGSAGALQRAPADPVLDLVHARSAAAETVGWAEMVAALEAEVDASAEELEGLLADLVAHGFFELRFRTAGDDPSWPLRLAEELSPASTEPAIAGVIRALTELAGLADRLGAADAAERERIVERGARVASASLAELAIAAPEVAPRRSSGARRPSTGYRVVPEGLFLEDTATDLELSVDARRARTLADSLTELAGATALFEAGADDRGRLHERYDAAFGDRAEVEVLRLLEEAARAAPAAEPPRSLGRSRARWLAGLELLVRERAEADRDSLDLSRVDLAPLAARSGAEWPAGASYAAVLQLAARSAPGPGTVLNGLGVGWGKPFGRFLHLLGESVTADLRAHNSAAARGRLLAEARDGSFFNANVHPPLLPHEVRTPLAHGRLPREGCVSLADLVVRSDREAGRLRLAHRPTGREVTVLDLGFEDLADRSALYRFLCAFAPAGAVRLQPLLQAVGAAWNAGLDTRPETAERTLVFPRVVWERDVVLHRRAVFVPRAALPEARVGESAWSTLRRVDDWRRAAGLPEHVFVTVDPWRGPRAYPPGARGRDAHKPQFVSLASPLFTDLFQSAVRRTRRLMKVEEMLPVPPDLLAGDGGRRVCEAVLQWSVS